LVAKESDVQRKFVKDMTGVGEWYTIQVMKDAVRMARCASDAAYRYTQAAVVASKSIQLAARMYDQVLSHLPGDGEAHERREGRAGGDILQIDIYTEFVGAISLGYTMREGQGYGRVTAGGSTDWGAREDVFEMRHLRRVIAKLDGWVEVLGKRKEEQQAREQGKEAREQGKEAREQAEEARQGVNGESGGGGASSEGSSGGGSNATQAKIQAALRRRKQLQARVEMHERRQIRHEATRLEDFNENVRQERDQRKSRRGSTIGGIGSKWATYGTTRGDYDYEEEENGKIRWIGSGQASSITRRERDLSYYLDVPPPTVAAWASAKQACSVADAKNGRGADSNWNGDMEFVREVLIPRLERRRKFRELQHKVEDSKGWNELEAARQEADAMLMTGRILGRRLANVGANMAVPGSPGSNGDDDDDDDNEFEADDGQFKEYARLWEAANLKEEKHKPLWATPMRERRRLSMLNSSTVTAAAAAAAAATTTLAVRGGAGTLAAARGAGPNRVGSGVAGAAGVMADEQTAEQHTDAVIGELESKIIVLEQKIQRLNMQGKPGDPPGLRGGKRQRQKGGGSGSSSAGTSLRELRRQVASLQARLKMHKGKRRNRARA
jgi:hypothetical protein